jgi:membrane-bound serine protease (ClpP class)
MATAMLEAKTPVAVYVAPQGAQAASAGFFLLMAADIAAMAPGTNTGAAHPVGGQGEDIEGTMGEKVEADSAAWVRSLAARNGRDSALAEAAVLESRSYTAEEALAAGLVDLVAEDLDELLGQLEARRVQLKDGESRTLQISGRGVRSMERTAFQKVRGALLSPNIAYLLLSLGGLGLWVEITSPGAIFPGVLGAIAFILGLYGTSALPVSTAGIAFLLLAGVLFFAEVKTGGFGVLGLGGIVSLVLGGLMLFQSPDPALRVSYQVIVALAVTSLLVVAPLSVLVWRARRHQVQTGGEGLVGETARAREGFVHPQGDGAASYRGKVDLHGEIWNALSEEPIESGATVRVVQVEGLTVQVRADGGT